ncbi:MAG: 50S ribosomal protein L9 [Chloroflexi bacterium]|nr:50S ribosomal protein L9 [Chloroflexota bacterium]
MKVVFLEDVEGVAQGGEVKDVKRGFARNYLIPQQLAMPATRDSMQRIDRLKKQAEERRLRTLRDMRELAEELKGKRVDVPMRAGAGGRLYGSVTNAIVADSLSELLDREIERRNVQIPDSIREVGTFEVRVHLYADIDAQVEVLVHPMEIEPEEFLRQLEERRAQAESGDDVASDETDEETDADETEGVPEVTSETEQDETPVAEEAS